MNVHDVKVTDEDDFLSRSMMIKAKVVDKQISSVVVSNTLTKIEKDNTAKLSEEKAQSTYEENVKINQERSHESRNLVQGDLVKLPLGDLIPADCVGCEIWTRPR